MQEGGSALMGTGIGRGENRATDAAQQAIASPLLDNVSVSGATGVLVNITGGDDLTLGDVHQIVEIVKDAVGEDAEIIFGTVQREGDAGRDAASRSSRRDSTRTPRTSPRRGSGAASRDFATRCRRAARR